MATIRQLNIRLTEQREKEIRAARDYLNRMVRAKQAAGRYVSLFELDDIANASPAKIMARAVEHLAALERSYQANE